MAKIDYKFWYIRRDDNGFITDCAVRFYEGDITTELELNPKTNQIEPITRYRRFKMLEEIELAHLEAKFIKDGSGKDCVFYAKEDFGNIKTDDELRFFLNQELKKDKKREPIKEQK